MDLVFLLIEIEAGGAHDGKEMSGDIKRAEQELYGRGDNRRIANN